MGCNPRNFQRMTTSQRSSYMCKVMRLHLHIAIANGIGLAILGFGGLGLVAYHALTK